MDVFIFDLQIRIRIRISEFHADTDVTADTICIHRRFFSLPPCSRARAATAALFRVSRAAFPLGRRAHAKIRPCAPLLAHPSSRSHSVILFSGSKIPQLTALAARTLPARRRRRPACLCRCCWHLCSMLGCFQVPLPVATTVGRGSTPATTLPFLLRRSRAQRQFDSRSRPNLLEGLSSIGGPSSRFPFRSAAQPVKVTF
jgi:hypothetical protein